jgi:putative FmdB family regulatory protein
MPMYDYTCRTCSHSFEALLLPGEVEVETIACPQCQGRNVDRQLGIPGQPKVSQGLPQVGACPSSGPPCGPACSRW